MNTSMVLNLVIAVALLLLAVFLGWLAFRAWRSRNVIARWGLGILTSLLTLAVAVVSILGLTGWATINAPRTTVAPD